MKPKTKANKNEQRAFARRIAGRDPELWAYLCTNADFCAALDEGDFERAGKLAEIIVFERLNRELNA
jgi:hypothetical protein